MAPSEKKECLVFTGGTLSTVQIVVDLLALEGWGGLMEKEMTRAIVGGRRCRVLLSGAGDGRGLLGEGGAKPNEAYFL